MSANGNTEAIVFDYEMMESAARTARQHEADAVAEAMAMGWADVIIRQNELRK
jgi:hypothetical protein